MFPAFSQAMFAVGMVQLPGARTTNETTATTAGGGVQTPIPCRLLAIARKVSIHFHLFHALEPFA